jgi:soluble P-type ATPase
MQYNPVGVGEITLDTIILDLNGTLAVDGKLVEGVITRIEKLKELGFKLWLFTGDQRGTAAMQARELGIELMFAKNTSEKAECAKKCNFETTVAIGNARIDIGTFENARIKIATLQKEGIHAGIIPHIDIIIPSINDALDLLINPDSFNATMRL